MENEKVVFLLLTGPHPIWHLLLSQLSKSLGIIYLSEYCNEHLCNLIEPRNNLPEEVLSFGEL